MRRGIVQERPAARRRRAAFTLSDLLIATALAALFIASAMEFIREVTASTGNWIGHVAVSTDGRRSFEILQSGGLRVRDATSGEVLHQLPAIKDYYLFAPAAISPDGRFVARLEPHGAVPPSAYTLQVYDLNSSREVLRRPVGKCDELAISADSKRLAIVNADLNQVEILNLDDLTATGKVAPLRASPQSSPNKVLFGLILPRRVVFNPQSDAIYFVNDDREIVKWDPSADTFVRVEFAPTNPGIIHQLDGITVSPDGKTLAIARRELYGNNFQLTRDFVELYDANTLTRIDQGNNPQSANGIFFWDGGQSLLIVGEDYTIREWSVQPLQFSRLYLAGDIHSVSVTPDGQFLAVANFDSVILWNSRQLLSSIQTEHNFWRPIFLFVAFVVLLATWLIVRHYRRRSLCSECGQYWPSKIRMENSRCPDCQMEDRSAQAISDTQARQKRKEFRVRMLVLAYVALAALSGFVRGGVFDSILGILSVALIIVVFAVFFVILRLKAQRRAFRRFRDPDFSLKKARQAADADGRLDEYGPVTLWTNVPQTELGPSGTARAIAAEIEDCRQRLETLTGAACGEARPIRLYLFDTVANVRKFFPLGPRLAEHSGLYFGPLADIGCLSLEFLRKRLSTLSAGIRPLLSYHLLPWPRGRFGHWLGFGVHNYVGIIKEPGAQDGWRRAVAVWLAEETLLPLRELFTQSRNFYLYRRTTYQSPQQRQQSTRFLIQWMSLIDYLGGPDAPPMRRAQLHLLWKNTNGTRSIDRVCRECFGSDLAELEGDWKTWVAAARFGAPVMAPAEVARAIDSEALPLIRDPSAPLQRRARALHALGSWRNGVEVLIEMLSSDQSDLRQAARQSLQMLSGKIGENSPEYWQAWLNGLPAESSQIGAVL